MPMNNVSGFGVVIDLIASKTYPVGFPITQFADDADPLSFGAVQIADTAMGLNGDLIGWSRAQTLPMVLNVIPGSVDDENLQIVADANRVGQGKASVNDEITATVVYPDGQIVIMSGGVIVSAEFGRGISSNGKQKTKSYSFSFASKA